MHKRWIMAVSCAGLLASISAVLAADHSLCSPQNPTECLDGVSGTVTSFDALRVRMSRGERTDAESEQRDRQAQLRPSRVAASGGTTGIGLTPSGWGLWAGLGRARFEGTVPIAPYDARLDTFTLGVDRLFGGRFLLGAALINERLDTTTRYNAGGQDADGYTLTGYGSLLVNDSVSVDLTLGRGKLDTTQRRVDPRLPAGTGAVLRSAYDADRTLRSLTVNAQRQIGALGLGARLGYLDARERQDGYQESGGPSARIVNNRTVSLAQTFLGVDASYGIARNWQIHGAALYRRDSSRDDGRSGGGLPGSVGVVQPADRDEREWVIGVRFYGGRNFKLNLEYLNTSGRDQFKNESFTFTGRFDF